MIISFLLGKTTTINIAINILVLLKNMMYTRWSLKIINKSLLSLSFKSFSFQNCVNNCLKLSTSF